MEDDTGQPLHFLWITNYDGFRLAEIDHNIEASAANAAMIFDCWTPVADRGCGHYSAAIRQVAAHLQHEGRTARIFSGATNVSSLRGILKTGSPYQFSFTRRTRLGRSVVTQKETTTIVAGSSLTILG